MGHVRTATWSMRFHCYWKQLQCCYWKQRRVGMVTIQQFWLITAAGQCSAGMRKLVSPKWQLSVCVLRCRLHYLCCCVTLRSAVVCNGFDHLCSYRFSLGLLFQFFFLGNYKIIKSNSTKWHASRCCAILTSATSVTLTVSQALSPSISVGPR